MVFISNKATCFSLSSGHLQVLPKFLLQEFLYNVRALYKNSRSKNFGKT